MFSECRASAEGRDSRSGCPTRATRRAGIERYARLRSALRRNTNVPRGCGHCAPPESFPLALEALRVLREFGRRRNGHKEMGGVENKEDAEEG